SLPPSPPPVLSALSLHDALPICGGKLRGRRIRRYSNGPRLRHGHRCHSFSGTPEARPCLSHRASVLRFRELSSAEAHSGEKPSEDRKSTRLNSSHEWISYAVFCF